MYSNLLIVIVVYKKKLSTLRLLSEISSDDNEVDVFIYDNSPIPQNAEPWQFVTYFHDPTNPGVSTAYNRAFAYAKGKNKQAVLILDQDTNFKLHYISEYMKCHALYNDSYIYAPVVCDELKRKIYSPAFLKNFVGKAQIYKSVKFHELYDLSDKSVINSGLMIPLVIFDKVKGFNEAIKLDFSDIFFIEKYKKINSQIVLVAIEMEHDLSGDGGADVNSELLRFKYYCNGAKVLADSLKVNTHYTCARRMIRLIMKYRTIEPVFVYLNYFIGRKLI